ncbi:MAG: hypothetical protein ABIO61_08250 [Thermomonas sp.]
MSASAETFDYLAVFFSIILGLAVTEILQGFRRLLIKRDQVVLYLPALLWAGVLLAMQAQAWWAMFGLRGVPEWTFGMYAIVLLQTILFYMVAGLALPDLEGDGELDMQAAYMAQARPFFLLMVGVVVISLLKDVVIHGELPGSANLAFHVGFAVTAIIAAMTRNAWYHRINALLATVLFAVYIGALFDRIG